MTKILTMIKFLNTKPNTGNCYIRFKTLSIYIRIGPVVIDNIKYKAITIANITNKNRASNIIKLPKNEIRRTGILAEFLTFTEKTAKDYKFDGVFIENVLNDFLPDVLMRKGYKQVNIYHKSNPPHFWKQV